MKRDWLRNSMPRSLYARAALILLLPILTIQLVLAVTFIQRLYEDVTAQMTDNVLLDIRYLMQRIERAPDLATAQLAVNPVLVPLAIDVTLPSDGPQEDSRFFYDLSGRIVIDELRAGLPGIIGIDLKTVNNRVDFLIETRHGPARVDFSRRLVSARNPHQLLVLMIGVSVIMTVVSALFLRNQLRPIKRLSRAATAFGHGSVVPYRPTGSTEVRTAGTAFLDMRNRIERQIEQRNLLLSGVGHDLRTPLTRLKLGLSLLPQDDDTRAMERDVDEMEHMLDGFLDFMRGEALDDPEEVNAGNFVSEIIGRASKTGKIAFSHKGEGEIMLRPMAVSRAIQNLIGNARRYGNKVVVRSVLTPKALKIAVEDDGPGIPPDRREEAIKPFTRLDEARNQDKGTGVGLGLAITSDIANGHGGVLRLGESADLGGLRAEIVLPR